ncbi:myotubularin-related protein 14-like [Stegodyphus dumicola]|uniref:myotubularin-related protein 14-like n=1 Tax=Stegodyphus dumicola TaxID=202533 RepID=UPI0015A881FD|nr:myotubularin-related protein 14-like [Stegodyphus dumicola]
MEEELEVSVEEIQKLFERASKNHYNAKNLDRTDYEALKLCRSLFEKDYVCEFLDNHGDLTLNYPAQIIIPVKVRNVGPQEQRSSSKSRKLDVNVLRKYVQESGDVRAKRRFPAPAIFFEGKFVCRSAAACDHLCSQVFEMRAISHPLDPEYREIFKLSEYIADYLLNMEDDFEYEVNIPTSVYILLSAQLMEEMKKDIELLKYLGVRYLCDVRAKKVECPKALRSVENIGKEHYKVFRISQLPYPDYQLFKAYTAKNRNPVGLKFKWRKKNKIKLEIEKSGKTLKDERLRRIDYSKYQNANIKLKVPHKDNLSPFRRKLKKYQKWDLVDLTKHYLLLLLEYIIFGKGGMLVHCAVGWDRTPIFIALLRLSLWADGWIHVSLTPLQMTYLTLAYDWYLFGHSLPHLLEAKCEILHFCYNFLQFIWTDDFSSTKKLYDSSSEKKCCRRIPIFEQGKRREKLEKVWDIFSAIYKPSALV